MLTDKDCTVTLAHSKTKRIFEKMLDADVVVSAVGKPKHFDLDWCLDAEIVIDVGINRDENGKLCGDFGGFVEDEFNHLNVTPVPNGVGLLTRAMLMQNVAEASVERNKLKMIELKVDEKHDVVNHPSHYCQEGSMECIDEMIAIFGKTATRHFCLLNAWKYRKRAIYKNGQEDMKKSDWYINKYLELGGKPMKL